MKERARRLRQVVARCWRTRSISPLVGGPPRDRGEAFVEKVMLGPMAWVYPNPIVLCGANVRGRPNYSTLGDCGIVGVGPPLVYVSLRETHYTTEGIDENQTFSVNFPSTKQMAVTDYCGMVSGRDVDKSALFTNFYGELRTAPMVRECPVNLECRVEQALRLHGRAVFIGQVVQLHASSEYVTARGRRRTPVDLPLLDPLLYSLDNRYYCVGQPIGGAFSEGKYYFPAKAPHSKQTIG